MTKEGRPVVDKQHQHYGDQMRPPAARVASEVAPLDEVERRYAKWALEQLGGRRMDTAKALGISHPTFAKLVKDEPGD